MELIAGIVFALSLLGNWGQASKISDQRETINEQSETIEALTEANQTNIEAAIEAAEIAKGNEDVVADLNQDLIACAEKLRSFEASQAVFDRRRQNDALAIEELENLVRDSDLDSCRVPDRVVDEITRNY